MTIGGRGLFQADDGLGQFACKVMPVELAEHLFQLTSSAGGFDSLFHDFSNLSLDKKGREGMSLNAYINALIQADMGEHLTPGVVKNLEGDTDPVE